MIELLNLAINTQEDVVELRNKILMLFQELEFDYMTSVNLTTKVSDLIHNIYMKENAFDIKLGFKHDSSSTLIISINVASVPLETFKNSSQLLNIEFIESEKGDGGEVYLWFPIKSHHFSTDKSHLEKLKEKMIVESKSELIRQIKNKNIELKKLLEDLQKSSGLIQSEKMRALGILTAGVAHELNNPMMGILNFIQYCLKKTDESDKRHEALKSAELETKRCIEIVANLLTFSHLEKEGGEFKSINIASLVKRVIKILSYRLRNEQVTIEEEIANDIPIVMGHENRLQQVILNLVTNALDAMKKSETKCLGLKLYSSGNNIKIIISDTGEGMNEETKRNIFEPFFTTKPTGLGTGLGLSVCESIIKEHAGNIICHTEINKGTEFSIILPIATTEDL